MSRNIGPFIDIVRLEDKEAKLKAFIRTVVEQSNRSASPVPSDQMVLLIARSVESPVARAVAALVREGTITVPVKSILALVPRENADVGIGETLSALVASSARVVRDARLFDAHEQLVLGSASSWIGDCMRRDPTKRDAYECFGADCSKTAGWARTSFERLWAVCDPLPEDVALATTTAETACLAAIAEEAPAADAAGSSST